MAFQKDFNDGSFKNAATYSTTDWEHINPGGGIDKGRDIVLKTVRAVHQTFLKVVTMRIERMDIRFLTPDVAIADVIHRADNYTTPDGVKHENEGHIKTYVVVKKKGKWLLAQDLIQLFKVLTQQQIKNNLTAHFIACRQHRFAVMALCGHAVPR